MNLPDFTNWGDRLKAAGIHVCLSAFIGACAAALVFWLWYPWPYRAISGGQKLFILIVSVDLVLGPMLTFVVFSRGKAKSLLIRDLAVIAVLQLSGLGYGLHTVFLARPIAMVYETGRFRVVTNMDVVRTELPQALPELRHLSLSGPKFLGTREPRNGDEKLESIRLALNGTDVGNRPSFWQPYKDSIKNVLIKARPVSVLAKQYPAEANDIEKYCKEAGRIPAEVKFLPIIAKNAGWSALVDARTGEIFSFIPLDGFF